ncbi:MAG: hypothetical protein GX653_03240 [Clostridiales bacterium]|nr:hypothetical protein [Clostridiales bacterium]
MFGYVVANLDKLTPQQRGLYQAAYCGLCVTLGNQHGLSCRLTLTYDMAFLIILLSSLADEEPAYSQMRCAVHPLKKRSVFVSQCTPYAADMNLMLAHAKSLDDWADDRKLLSLSQAKVFERAAQAARTRHPRQGETIDQCLRDLSAMEKEGEVNPDLPANAFGRLLGEIFVHDEKDSQADALRDFGFALGRFIYLMDAVMDLKEDIRKERYNPLVLIPTERHEALLHLQMAQCAACYDRLKVPRNGDLIENILYSGVWTKYSARHRKEAPTP